MMADDPEEFRRRVQESLRRQIAAINKLTDAGMYFFDYGNAFLLESSRAGADVMNADGEFRYPSYVQDIMGPLFFDYGFGPFRWVCTSGTPEDLAATDRIAARVLEQLREEVTDDIRGQLDDNIHWIKSAAENHLVVGSQARILYADSRAAHASRLLSTRLSATANCRLPWCSDATTTTCRAPILLIVRHPISMTAPTCVPTWPSTM